MTRVALVGVGGYTGQESLRLVLGHPRLELAGLFGSPDTAGKPLEEVVPSFRGVTQQTIGETSAKSIAETGAEIAILATPHELSMRLAPELLGAGVKVFDLSGAFRLSDPSLYPTYYGFTHETADLIYSAAYGLPELYATEIREARLITLPGCYATSVILPVTPLVREGVLDADRPVVVDATSGVSGAGRKASTRTSFCEVSQSPYGVGFHRHTPEMSQYTGADVVFTPHLGPYERGILSTIHADLQPGVTREQVVQTLERVYCDQPFVRVLPSGEWPTVKGVEHTNMIDIGVHVDERRHHMILISAIDNLLKGASGQGVQAINAHFGWDQRLGLMPGGGA
ncbi:MAG: N-acetyl-gamma-glutamyl-phosphate reductase [Phycisphaerales bacterium JB058]